MGPANLPVITGTPPLAFAKIAMTCASAYLPVFNRNLLVHRTEKDQIFLSPTFRGKPVRPCGGIAP